LLSPGGSRNIAIFYRPYNRQPLHRINERISAPTLRVINSEGKQIGVLSREEALQKAREAGEDLVEIAGSAQPPVVRILDYKKFLYEESKKDQAAKKNAKDVELKELWFTPRTADHDLHTRLRRVDEFLKDGNKIMIRIKFKGREMAHTELGFETLKRIMAFLGDKVSFERAAKLEGRSITAIIGKNKQNLTPS